MRASKLILEIAKVIEKYGDIPVQIQGPLEKDPMRFMPERELKDLEIKSYLEFYVVVKDHGSDGNARYICLRNWLWANEGEFRNWSFESGGEDAGGISVISNHKEKK